MTLQEAIAVIREIEPSVEETNSRRAETLILQAIHDGAEIKFPTDIISLHMAVETKAWAMVWAAEPLRKVNVEMTYQDLWNIAKSIWGGYLPREVPLDELPVIIPAESEDE